MPKPHGPKIAVVGGGSYTWSPQLLSDLMRTPELDGSEIVLLDPDQKAAGEILAAGRAIKKALGSNMRLRATSSQTGALRDADFVLITVSTGGLDAMERDLAIPEKYGVFHTVGDSVGPAGWNRTLRNAPVFADLAGKIARLAPRAVVLNYTNPLAALTAVLCETGGLRAVGLCHGVYESYHVFQKLFSVEEKDLAVNFAGVNHFFWILDFTVKGRPGYPLLRERLGRKSLHETLRAGTADAIGYHSHHAFCSMLLDELGLMPYVGDRHTCEFLPGFIAPTLEALAKYRLRRTSADQRRKGRDRARGITLEIADGKRPPPPRSREIAADIMRALVGGEPFMDVVNLPNVGQIENLPRGAVVETPGLIDALGFRPIATGPLPPHIRQIVEPHCVIQQLTVEAALCGDREKAIQALMLDPASAHLTPSEIRAMGRELMSATKKWLPRFR